MHRLPRRAFPLVALAIGLIATGCGPSPASTSSPTVNSSANASASTTPSVPPASATTSASASAEPSASSPGSATPSASGFPTAFAIEPDPEADALFEAPDSCRNPQDGYTVAYPDPWYTNTQIRDVPACSWFSPTFYEVDDFATRPDEIAIEIFWLGGDRGHLGEELSRERGIVGGQYAVRIEVEGTPDDPSTGRSFEYVVQLGPTSEGGPNLVVRTDTSMGGDYELNKAILERIMASIEFLGSTQ